MKDPILHSCSTTGGSIWCRACRLRIPHETEVWRVNIDLINRRNVIIDRDPGDEDDSKAK